MWCVAEERGRLMTEDTDKKYCCVCGKEIIIGVFKDASHQEYNFIAHIMGQPMFCSDCWNHTNRKGNDND